jgi:predicted phosphate transport protein (TIGR00153 family)
MRLLPRQEKFFTSFLDQVRLISEAASLLYDAVKEGNSHLSRAAARIQQLEHEGDEIIHDIFTRLNQTFITPLDPEDIHSLSSRLDDVLDGIEDAAYRMVAYRLEPIPPEVVELCEVVRDCAKSLEMAFEKLNKDEKLLDDCIEVNRLEDYADLLVRRAVAELFQQEKDPIALIKKKEIYEFLEETTDRCEDVADVLQNVVVKNS